MTDQEINELFEYRDGKLFARSDRGFNKTKGKECNAISGKYFSVRINYRLYYVHRLIWIMHFGPIPDGMMVDHEDGNGFNNQISNLRLANKSQNGCNRGRSKANTSGYKGVMFYKAYKKWTAQIEFNGKRKSLGYFETPEEAFVAYQTAAKIYHGQFAKA